MAGGEWRVAGGEWRVASGGWRVAGVEWRVAGGEWRVASGEWRVASGEWRVAGASRKPVVVPLTRGRRETGEPKLYWWSGRSFECGRRGEEEDEKNDVDEVRRRSFVG